MQGRLATLADSRRESPAYPCTWIRAAQRPS